jgi:predicted Kef-type K+ transport protein
MDYLWVATAFFSGFLVKQINLPPLIGYLAAGFGLHALGVEPDESLDTLAEMGVVLLLFTIGLKLNVRSLLRPEIWLTASAHMALVAGLTIVNCLLLGIVGMSYFVGLDWAASALIGFAVSFSSTVCAVKILEEKGELRARHGQIAIGILIMQDIAAVVFVTLATDKSPSLWAFGLLALPLLKPLLHRLLERCGHGEVLPLAGFFFAFMGGALFEALGLKAELGALVVAVLLAGHPKSSELAKSLMNFKDIFLIGFFLSIGFTALPTLDMMGAALIMAIALPVKSLFFFLFQTALKLRGRTAFLSALTLTNYSEFGLIVCAAAVAHGILPKEWLVIMALAVSLSFVFSSIVNTRSHHFYTRWNGFLKRFERGERLPEDQFSQPTGTVLVVGMGRVGSGAYDSLQDDLDKDVCGLDVDRELVEKHQQLGRKAIVGDTEDPDFWDHIDLGAVELIVLTVPKHQDILETNYQLKRVGYKGKTAGIAHYEDEKQTLIDAGLDVVFNFYANAGAGLAERSLHLFNSK